MKMDDLGYLCFQETSIYPISRIARFMITKPFSRFSSGIICSYTKINENHHSVYLAKVTVSTMLGMWTFKCLLPRLVQTE